MSATKKSAPVKPPPRQSSKTARILAAETALRGHRKAYMKIRSLRVREERMHEDMKKFCEVAWKEGLRSAPAGGNRRYCLRDPADGGGFYFLNLSSAVVEVPKNLTEETLGAVIHDWVKRSTLLTHEISSLKESLPSQRELYALIGVLL